MTFPQKNTSTVKTDYTPLELAQKMEKQNDFLMLDIRESVEIQICQIENALHIPMGQIPFNLNKLSKNKNIVVFCHMGVRSRKVVNYLRKNGFVNVFNLKGGIDRWTVEVDSSLQRYR